MSTENSIVIEPKGEVKKAVIWLHGLGADGGDFVPVVDELNLPEEAGIRFIFPHAPVMPVTINAGMQMRAWYDIAHQDLARKVDMVGIMQSVEAVANMLAEQNQRGLQLEDMVLAGFSQGGVVALQTALQLNLPLAGVMALSCYVPLRESIETELKQNIFLAHGVDDGVVPYSEALSGWDWLKTQGHEVSWHSYPMMHSVCTEEIADISDWLRASLSI